MAKLAAATYGNALFELAVEESKVDQLNEEAEAVLQVLKSEAGLSKLMDHPKIVKEEKNKILESIFKGRVSDDMVGFLLLLLKKDHYAEVIPTIEYFLAEVKEYKKIGIAYVTTAVELSQAQKKAVEAKLLTTTGYLTFEMHFCVDAALIGGMIIRVGDRVVDSSVRSKLMDLSRDLMKLQLA
ncbi:ATP synthase F1 subunit delta [Diplocloster hominis]|uniref:ATP synthase F1 subunit delta n=1 Tax=Diplocloster hominis TaxID=3079010 RepID=UPI0031BAC803